MKMNTKLIFSLIIFLFLIGGVGVYIYTDITSMSQNRVKTEEVRVQNTISSAEIRSEEIGQKEEVPEEKEKPAVKLGGVEYEEVGSAQEPPQPIPSLDRALVFPERMPEKVVAQTRAEIVRISNELKKEPLNHTNWVNLGLYRKAIDDFEGAREAWEYAKLVDPTLSVVYGNLGNLYGYELHDFPKAEQNFREAVKLAPALIYLYAQAAIFAKDVMKDIEKAREFIRLGIEYNPENSDLKAALQELGG